MALSLNMPLLIRNADIVNADSRTRGDIYIEDETITRIGPNLETLSFDELRTEPCKNLQ